MKYFSKDGKTRRCGHMVRREVSSFRSVKGQCKRGARIVRTDGQARCRQHDPVAIAERERQQAENYDKRLLKWRMGTNGERFYAVLKRIAAGHNDARGLAQATLRGFDDGG